MSPAATSAWNCASVTAASVPDQPPVDITAVPLARSNDAALCELDTAADHVDVVVLSTAVRSVLVVAPPMIPANMLVPIPDRLRALIRRHNHVSCEAACIQLRSALHLGPVHHDGYGFIGADVNHLGRLLDTRQLKQRLSNSTTEIGLIASDYLYLNVIRRHPSFVDPTLFDPVRMRVKETKARAWIYLPGI